MSYSKLNDASYEIFRRPCVGTIWLPIRPAQAGLPWYFRARARILVLRPLVAQLPKRENAARAAQPALAHDYLPVLKEEETVAELLRFFLIMGDVQNCDA